MRVLVVNSGSSSIKYQLLEMATEQVVAKGLIAHLTLDPPSSASAAPAAAPHKNHAAGLEELFATLDAAGAGPKAGAIAAIGHRIVHGGARFAAPTLIDDAVCEAIAAQSVLAPLHNPANLAGILAARQRLPDVPQVAVFDTAFHHGIPAVAATYALPPSVARAHGIRRYGFHGTNCAWCLAAAADHFGRPPGELNLIVAHLGAGASVTAIRAGRSIDTSMGMTPLEGLMMQTRSGDIDPAVPLLLLRNGMSAAEIDQLLNFRSGVGGICGESDMLTVARRSLAGDPDASFARDMYGYRAAKYIGAYAGLVWPLDALVFTAGVGENDARIRAQICARLPQLGITLDPALNEASAPRLRAIGAPDSRTAVLVIPANEELQIARETVSVLAAARARPS